MRPSAVSARPVRCAFLNPCSSAATEYVPTGRLVNEKTPEPSVTRLTVSPVAAFVAVTVTPGSTPPDESVMRPEIWPVMVCASAAPGRLNSAMASKPASASRRLPTKTCSMSRPPGFFI